MIKYSQNGVYDYSGFGFNHTVTLDKNMIISDTVSDDAFIQKADTQNIAEYASYYIEPAAKAASVPYSAEKAIAYADKYALTYNTAYKNMNDVGGDCCNFVSQCLFAGGIPMSDGWYYKSQSNFSSSWSLVKSNIAYFSSFGTFIKNPQPSQVKAGNPVYYYSATSTDGAHTSICVGTNAAGTPVINAHNNDRYRVDWTLGGSKYFPGGNSTIQLNVAAATTTATATTTTTTTSATTKPDNTSKVAGDANSDGVVNSKDVLILRKHLAKMAVQIDLYLSDVNADGFVDTKDLLLLRKYLAGQNVVLKLK